MSNQPTTLYNFTILSKVQNSQEASRLVSRNETILACYQTVRDIAVLTDRRWIFQNVQGVTGIKKETFSLPLTSILFWSIENAGVLNSDGTLTLYTPIGNLVIKVSRALDFDEIDKLLSQAIFH